MPKAYTIVEYETLDAAAQAENAPTLQAAIKAAGGRQLLTPGGKVTAVDGMAPKGVNLVEWETLAQANAFRDSAAYKAFAPHLAKAIKITRRYVVESGS